MFKELRIQKFNVNKTLKRLSLILPVLCLSACASTQKTAFSVVYEHKQCAYADPGIFALQPDKQYAQLVNKLLPFHDETDKTQLSTLLSTHQAKQRLFLLAQGSKPTPGYGFDVLDDIALIEGHTLYLPIRFTAPDKGMMMAQVITSPCMIFGVDKNAEFQRIEADSLQLEMKQPN